MASTPPDHLCGLGYSPADARQSEAENKVCWHAERRIVDTPSVTLLAVLDYAARARQAVPTYTPLAKIDDPQPALPDAVREACARMQAEAEQAERAARRAAAREYAARMAAAIEREREDEARRQRAMKEHGVTETPEEAARAQAALESRIAVYQRELDRISAETGLATEAQDDTAPEAARSRAILAAMRAWAGPRLKWGRHRGAPWLRALRRATGLGDITGPERNRLWRAFRAGAPAEGRVAA